MARGEDLWDCVVRDAVGGDLDEGADEVADHVMEEAVAGDAVEEEVLVLMPGGVVDGADVAFGAGGGWR